MDFTTSQDLMIVAKESLWWLGLALILVLAFVLRHISKLRVRKNKLDRESNDAKTLWMEVQQRRSKHTQNNKP